MPGGALGPQRVGEEFHVSRHEAAILFKPQQMRLRVVAVIPLGDGLQRRAIPAGEGGRQRRGIDDFLKLLDIVDDGLAELAQCGSVFS